MLEIESFWKGLPGFRQNEKGQRGIGYGFWKKRGKEQPTLNGVIKNHRRKSYRQIRKFGFDLSELWGLDYTIMYWLSDNVGGFFRLCGQPDDWHDYDLEGNPYDFWEHYEDQDWGKKTSLYSVTRTESFQKHLKDFLDNPPSQEIYTSFKTFVIPRLRMLAKTSKGYPASDDFPSFKDWAAELNNMADKFEENTYSPYFIEYFFSLWD